MEKLPISVTMMVKNGERYLARSLEALKEFDEVVILDNGSADKSKEIAQGFENVSFYEAEFFGFGPMKNDMAEKARNPWVLNIDCDEILSPELIDEIRGLDLTDTQKVYALSRINHYREKPIKTCGWYPDFVKRLYCKDKVAFNLNQVHESLVIPKDCQLVRLKGEFAHFTSTGVNDLVEKMHKYTTLSAKQSDKKVTIFASITHGLAAFLKSYLLRRGFLDGAEGFIISMNNAIGAYYKYVKIYEKTH